ncbi:hypothetical protein ABNQ39_00310 (plasmid) [Azospirillum sp. A26]|uniref:hypothetical protein n=1 Tax=Azospirillum sp. A26 TaxID=3160607 RepID=UPI00366AC80F
MPPADLLARARNATTEKRMPDWWHRLAAEEMRLLCYDPTGATWREMVAEAAGSGGEVG